MGLVDYSSSDNDSDDSHDDSPQPPAKRPKISAATPSNTLLSSPAHLPPLPSSFHNLYATTVRPAPADLPSLHQGRKRLIPHVQGNWPSHVFIEWHPSPAHHEALTALVTSLQTELRPHLLGSGGGGAHHHHLTTFLTSDLGAPLPLHISLSRPFVLRTAQKAPFRDALARRIAGAAAPFELRVADLAWFRSVEAARSFLVLRVRAVEQQQQRGAGVNPQLVALLAACNEVVVAQGQPRLYARRQRGDGVRDEGEDVGEGVQPVVEEENESDDAVDGAFHVSIAWSFAEPTEDIRSRTAAVFARERGLSGVMGGIRIWVAGIKVKIGNVVSDISLGEKGEKDLFGV